MATKDYYLTLGVARTASSSDVRAAFRKLAKRYHPDHKGSEGTEAFQNNIVEAYEVLSDLQRRNVYNYELFQAEGYGEFSSEAIGTPYGAAPESLIPEPVSFVYGFRTIHPSFEPLFQRFRRNFTGFGAPKAEQAESLTLERCSQLMKPAEVGSCPSASRSSIPAQSVTALGMSGSFPACTAKSTG